jgi:hypothetical protein
MSVLTAMVRDLNSWHYSHGPLAALNVEEAAVGLAGYYSRRMGGVLTGKPT